MKNKLQEWIDQYHTWKEARSDKNIIAVFSSEEQWATPKGRGVGRNTILAYLGKPSFEEWFELGDVLGRIEGGVHWWLGDWCNYGEAAYGEKYAQALDETPFAYDTLRRDAYTAAAFEMGRRRPNLSYNHHRELLGLNQEEADGLLDNTEARLGELLAGIDKSGSKLKGPRSGSQRGTAEKSLPPGITKKESHYAQQLPLVLPTHCPLSWWTWGALLALLAARLSKDCGG